MILNRSRISTFLDCPRKYHHEYNPHPDAPHGLEPHRTSEALRIGLAFHRFLEVWYTLLDTSSEERMTASLTAAALILLETAPSDNLPAFGSPDEEETIALRVESLCRDYVRKWSTTEPFTVLKPELEFLAPLGSGHFLKGRTDAIVEYLGRVWLLENKTTSYLGQSYVKRFHFSHQLISYKYGVQHALGTPIAGAMLNAVRKPNYRAKVSHSEFLRETIQVTDDQVEHMLSTFTIVADEIEQRDDPASAASWPQNTNRCQDYGGCPWFAVCALGAEARPGPLYKARSADYVDEARVK
jgi:PD-(D/E)XK nuclease superfamily